MEELSCKMSGKVLLSEDSVYQQIQAYYKEHGSSINIKKIFEEDDIRFDKFR